MLPPPKAQTSAGTEPAVCIWLPVQDATPKLTAAIEGFLWGVTKLDESPTAGMSDSSPMMSQTTHEFTTMNGQNLSASSRLRVIGLFPEMGSRSAYWRSSANRKSLLIWNAFSKTWRTPLPRSLLPGWRRRNGANWKRRFNSPRGWKASVCWPAASPTILTIY